MKDSDINQLDNEAGLFEQLKAEIRHKPGYAFRCWEEIRERYVYGGRQYSAQQVIDWFMNAPFDEVKAISNELETDWRRIGGDVQRMAEALKGFDDGQGLLSEISEPFGVGRDTSRLLFDFSILVSCTKKTDNSRILDFAGGTGWIAEYLNRVGFDVYTFDVEPLMVHCVERRIQADHRVDGSRLHAAVCDAHNLKIYEDGYFGNIVCFDSLHHMADFGAAFGEMFRVLEPGGRASFAEPGDRHAQSKETKAFIRKYKADDPDWIEKSIVIEDINRVACSAGFDTLTIKPFLLPSAVEYSLDEWKNFERNREGQAQHISHLISFNSNERVIFYVDKPQNR